MLFLCWPCAGPVLASFWEEKRAGKSNGQKLKGGKHATSVIPRKKELIYFKFFFVLFVKKKINSLFTAGKFKKN